MRKFLLLLIPLILLSFSANSQKYTKKFLGDYYPQYLGASFIPNPESSFGWDKTFFLTLDQALSESTVKAAFRGKGYKWVTDINKLPPSPFKVVEVLERKDNPKIGYRKALFRLIAADDREFWFKYDTGSDYYFPFLVGEIEMKKDVICAKISAKVDEFTDEKSYDTPSLVDATVSKNVNAREVVTYLRLTASGSTCSVGEQGVIILMSDGSKMEFPNEKIYERVGKYGFDYSALIRLSESDLEKLSSTTMDKWRLYIYERRFDEREAEVLRIQIGCITEMH